MGDSCPSSSFQMPTSNSVRSPLRSQREAQHPARSFAPICEGYELTALLHDGPWSRIYRARAAGSAVDELGQYAIKALNPEASDLMAGENMLRREASIALSLQHENLVCLLHHELRTKPHYLVLPFLEGVSLETVFRADIRVPISHALWLVRQIAQALDALHSAGWLHGDMKPENIHVAPSGHVTLLDLGMARRVDAGNANGHQSTLMGTLKYMAPENFRCDESVDQRSDLYSLGVILYQLLAGRAPFVAPNAASLVNAHLHATPPDPSLIGCPVAADVRQLLAQLLAKEPLRRPHSAADLVQRLMRLEIATMVERVWVA